MTDFNTKRDDFAAQLDQLAGREPTVLDEDAALQAWESGLDAELADFRRRLDQIGERPKEPPEPAAPPKPCPQRPSRERFSHQDATLIRWFEDTDSMMIEELELGNWPIPDGFQGEIQIMDGDQAMKSAIAQACGLEAVPSDVRWKDYHLGVFHIPGHGTLLNPQHYTQKYHLEQLDDQDLRVLAHVVSDMAMERWGWGFLLEYTKLGRQAGKLDLWPAMLAYRARLPLPDRQALELAEAIQWKWVLLKTGWMDWVWQYVMFKARTPVGEKLVDRRRLGRIFELVNRIQALFPLRINPFGIGIRLRSLLDLLKFIFLEQSEISPRTNNLIIQNLQDLCVKYDVAVRSKFSMPLSRALGSLYFAALENKIGILSVPYAVLIAAHFNDSNLERFASGSAYNEFIEADARNSPDARLAMLTKLDARIKYDPRAMYTAAWERLKLDGPKEYFER